MLAGLVALRWVALGWAVLVLVVSYDDVLRPWLAVGLIAAALAFTVVATTWLHSSPDLLLQRPALVAEFVIATALVLCDGWVYGAGHAFSSSLSLGSIWPLAAVLSIGVAAGPWWGAAAGGVLGLARLGAALANGVRDFDDGRVFSLVNSGVFFAVAGAVAGYVANLLRRAEREISAARAREEMARELHDGVLQTLAVVQRRSDDADLVRLAREQDRDLRRFLAGEKEAAVRANGFGRRAARRGGSLRGRLRRPSGGPRAVRASDAQRDAGRSDEPSGERGPDQRRQACPSTTIDRVRGGH